MQGVAIMAGGAEDVDRGKIAEMLKAIDEKLGNLNERLEIIEQAQERERFIRDRAKMRQEHIHPHQPRV